MYVVGTAAALRLLPRGTWVRRGAVVAFVATLGLLALTGKYLLPQLVVGIAAVLWMWRQGCGSAPRRVLGPTGERERRPVRAMARPPRKSWRLTSAEANAAYAQVFA